MSGTLSRFNSVKAQKFPTKHDIPEIPFQQIFALGQWSYRIMVVFMGWFSSIFYPYKTICHKQMDQLLEILPCLPCTTCDDYY